MRFADRASAGRALAERCRHLVGHDAVVLGLPRGGVPVAREVARSLWAPLDVIVVRKLGVPWQPELAMGAVGEDGVEVKNADIVAGANVSEADFARVRALEQEHVVARAQRLRGARVRQSLVGRTAIVVDDGIATGATARAACQVARRHGAARVVLAVPVAPPGWTESMDDAADEYLAVQTPAHFGAVGSWYTDFTPVLDDEVARCLLGPPAAREQQLTIPLTRVELPSNSIMGYYRR